MARRYVEDHHGVLNCDIDSLRTFIGGWETSFAEAGRLIRPAALAMIQAYLAEGNDVVLPQMLVNPTELARFEACATQAGASFVERVLMDEEASAVSRFHHRGDSDPDDPWHAQVRDIVAAEGGNERLAHYHRALTALVAERPDAQVITSVEGAADQTYQALLDSLA